jgi:hypothetical protein
MCLSALAVAALYCAGCGGINASKTVSPLDFFLPGIMKNDVSNCTNSVASMDFKAPAGQNPAEIASTR